MSAKMAAKMAARMAAKNGCQNGCLNGCQTFSFFSNSAAKISCSVYPLFFQFNPMLANKGCPTLWVSSCPYPQIID